LNPNSGDALYNLGKALLWSDAGQAVTMLTKASRLKPNESDVFNNLGLGYLYTNNPASAVPCLRKALTLSPNNEKAHANLAGAFLALKKFPEAEEALRRSIELRDNAQARYYLGVALETEFQFVRAQAEYDEAIKIEPANYQANLAAARLAELLCDIPRARKHYATVVNSSNAAWIAISAAVVIAPVARDIEQIEQARLDIEYNLKHLLTNLAPQPTLTGATLAVRGLFYFAYDTVNVRPIMELISRVFRHVYPLLSYQAPSTTARKEGQRPRIGFYSAYVDVIGHPIGNSVGRTIVPFSQQFDGECHLITIEQPGSNAKLSAFAEFSGKRTVLPSNLLAAQSAIANLNLDVLVYLDIGMEPVSYLLGHARLARTQVVLGGHPITTGISTIDYYLSPSICETEDSSEHYTEKLVRLASCGFNLIEPPMPSVWKQREELNLPPEGPLYVCPMKLQKMHPSFDRAIAQILEADPAGHVVFIHDHMVPSWSEIFWERLKRIIKTESCRQRVIFLPWLQNRHDFLSLNAVASVVLDPFNFGIGTTSAFTFGVGTPIVTLPSPYLRGRVGYMFCKLLEVEECIATDEAHYVETAVKIANDTSLRQTLADRIRANRDRLFNNTDSTSELLQVVKSWI
jgi:predicted O-linked N-acetylglucosamine transferase (SPINDLY family)